MTSWRDSASPNAQADLDGLINAVLPFAEQQVETVGEFFPFGATVATEGQVAMVAVAGDDLGDRPASQAVLDRLYAEVRGDRGRVRAAGFVADVKVDGGDAIRAELEHAEGAALVILLPYSRSRLRKTATFGQLRVGSGQRHVWDGS